MDRKYSALGSWDQSLYAYEFEPFECIPTKSNFNLIHSLPNPVIFETLDDLVILQFEFPNCLVGGDSEKVDCFKYNSKVKKIITTCPFAVEYFNRKYNYDKLEFGFTPFNPKYTPNHGKKLYDVYFTGHIFNCPPIIRQVLPIMEQQYKTCFVCADYGTNQNISYQEKLALNAQSKVSIVYSCLHWPTQFLPAISKFEGYEAFSHVYQDQTAPQMKTRIIEAVASKSLIICLQDHWNLIESYFEEGKDFLYWKTPEDLNEKIHYILSHYDDYQPMIEHAYEVLINNFTTLHFFNNYLKDL
jgi:hypothetical protein